MLLLVKSAGLLPQFENYSDEELDSRLAVIQEFIRMIRENDSKSSNPNAQRMWDELVNGLSE